MRFLFGNVALDTDREELRVAGQLIQLGPVGFALLAYLIENRSHLVSREEIHRAVWHGRHIAASTIPTAVSALRRCLNDDVVSPRFIRSSYGRGYRFIAEVRIEHDAVENLRPESAHLLELDRQLEFIGRAQELALMGKGAALCRQPLMMFGTAGIGKTRLLERFAASRIALGESVLFARCNEVGNTAPYAPVLDLVRQLRSVPGAGVHEDDEAHETLWRLETGIVESESIGSADTGVDGRYRIQHAIASAFQHATVDSKMVVAVDDFHKADLASAQAIRFLLSKSPRLFLVIAYRDGELSSEISAELATMSRLFGSIDLELGCLNSKESAALVELRLGAAITAQLARKIFELTAGNAFFLTKVADLLRSSKNIGSFDRPEGGDLPRATRDAVVQHISGLSDDCREALVNASILGREFDRDLLRAAMNWSLERLDSAIDEAIVAGVLLRDTSLKFSHVLLRDALYDSCGVDVMGFHAKVFLAFGQVYGEPPGRKLGARARHAVLSANCLDAQDRISACDAAAKWAEKGFAFSEAANWYEEAISIVSERSEGYESRRCELLVSLAECQHRSDRRLAGQDSARRAFGIAQEVGDAQLMARAALAYCPGLFAIEVGVVDEFLVNALEDSALELGDSDPPQLRVEVLARLAMALYWTNDRTRREVLANEAVSKAESLGGSILGYAITAREVALWDSSRPEEKERVARLAVKLAVDSGEHEMELVYRVYRVSSLLQLGLVSQARSEINAFRTKAHLVGHSNSLWFVDLFEAMNAMILGDREQAKNATDAFVAKGRVVGDRNADHCRVVHRVYQKMEFGPIGDAANVANEQWQRYRRVGAYRCSMPFLFWESGDTLAARVAFEELAREGFEAIPRNVEWLIGMAMLSEICAAIGDRSRAEEIYRLLWPHRHECVVVGFGVAVFRPVAYFLGRLATTMGSYRNAEGHFSKSLAIAESAQSRPWRAHTEYGLAELLVRRNRKGDLARAERMLGSSLRISEALGMRPLADRVGRLSELLRANA